MLNGKAGDRDAQAFIDDFFSADETLGGGRNNDSRYLRAAKLLAHEHAAQLHFLGDRGRIHVLAFGHGRLDDETQRTAQEESHERAVVERNNQRARTALGDELLVQSLRSGRKRGEMCEAMTSCGYRSTDGVGHVLRDSRSKDQTLGRRETIDRVASGGYNLDTHEPSGSPVPGRVYSLIAAAFLTLCLVASTSIPKVCAIRAISRPMLP